jgi:hypothetical protein
MPLASFCNGVSPEHTNVLSDLQFGPWQATFHQMTPPLSGRRPPGFLRPGVAWSFNRVDPHHDDRSPWWIYPNLTDPSTSCHESVSSDAWKNDEARRPCGVGLVTERIRPVYLACARYTL